MGTVPLGVVALIEDLQRGIKEFSQHDLGLVRRFDLVSVSPTLQSHWPTTSDYIRMACLTLIRITQ